MALSLKNTFLEFEGLGDFGVPSAARRSASASVGSGARASDAPAAMRAQLERLAQAIAPAAPLPSRLEALSTTVAAPGAAEPLPKKPTAPRLQLPLSSRLKLSALSNIGLRQLQQRMAETTSAPALTGASSRSQQRTEDTTSAPALEGSSPRSPTRWADEPSDDESSGYASTRTPVDSDQSTAIDKELEPPITRSTMKKGNSTIKKGKSKDYRDEQFQKQQDCAMRNHWAFQGQWAPQYDGAWEAQKPSWRW